MNSADERKVRIFWIAFWWVVLFGFLYIPIASGIQYSKARRRLYGY